MSQDIFNPATVFNFFPPVNPIAGTTLNGPEFAIFDTNTSLARMNFINAAVYQVARTEHDAGFQSRDHRRHFGPDGGMA